MDETSKKAKDIWLLVYLTRYPDLSPYSIKVILLALALRLNTNCIRLSKDDENPYDDIRVVGISKKALQEKVMGQLEEHNILIPLNKGTNRYIDKRICSQCPIKKDSDECIKRHATHWININVKDWHLYKRTRINRTRVNEILTKNRVSALLKDKKPLNDKIKEAVNRTPSKESGSKSFQSSIAFQDFFKNKGIIPPSSGE